MEHSRRDFLKQSAGIALASPSLLTPASAPETRTDHARVLRFAVASDGHFGQPKTDYQTFTRNVVDHLNAEKERSGLDLCFFNGDLIHDDPRFMPEVKTAFDRLTMPYYVTRGNHDMVSPEVWKQIWGYEENHVVELDDCAFVLGNTSNPKGEYVCADPRWLGSALDKQRRKKHVFVLLHIPQRKWTANGIDCPAVMETIERYPNVKAVFHGHEHDQDDVKVSGGKPYIFDGHFGGSWGTAYKGYRIVEVFADGKISTYQFNPEVRPIVNAKAL
ncbi:metallophosphoesterase family protein [Larkinella soli]|uniref:metallophosphoesterase family protein n=1 Tax=Larkinella soli TaxID=1770527 RepID=UPI000FFB12ED|nr:metallophosphoesterase [Larkinella soli]